MNPGRTADDYPEDEKEYRLLQRWGSAKHQTS